jgi:hypothetical protein
LPLCGAGCQPARRLVTAAGVQLLAVYFIMAIVF